MLAALLDFGSQMAYTSGTWGMGMVRQIGQVHSDSSECIKLSKYGPVSCTHACGAEYE
jgi:hypothetical protein